MYHIRQCSMLANNGGAEPLPEPPNVDGIPTELKQRRRWVPVRGHWVITGDVYKLNKTPLRPGGGFASASVSGDWWSFDDALSEVRAMLERRQPALLFYVIDPDEGLVYGDVDHSLDENGQIDPAAQNDIDGFTYIEVSPSGRGLRWIARGVAGQNREAQNNTRAIHVGGYISVTGHTLPGRDKVTAQQLLIESFEDLCGATSGASSHTAPADDRDPPPVDTDDLSLSDEARALLENMVAPVQGRRSDVVQSIANALAGDLGLEPVDVFAVLRHHPGVRQVALDRRRGRVGPALDWLWNLAQHSEPARAKYVGDWIPRVHLDTFEGPEPVGRDLFGAEKPHPPEVLIDGLIPCDVFGWVGAGGLAKTTLMLWLMVHIVTGRRVAGRPVRHPGPVLFLTAEDDLAVVRYRLREICDGLELTDVEREQVALGVYVEDVTGMLLRFVEGDRNSNLTITPHVDNLCKAYADIRPVLIVADPAIFFGPGESRVNDAEAALMAVGRRIGSELRRDGRRAAFGWIHHVSQVVAREGIVDQYASRGGTAFADNSRAQVVFSRHTTDHPKYAPPADVLPHDIEEGRVLRMHIAKFSYGAHADQPLWVVRGAGAGAFTFNVFDSPASAEAEAVREAERRQAALDDAVTVFAFLDGELKTGAYHTKTSLREQVGRVGGGVSVRRVASAVSHMLSTGCLRETPLPAEASHGGRSTYLHPVRSPAS